MIGLVIKGIGGFYYVKLDNGNIIECKGRGKLKNKGTKIMVGDQVEIDLINDEHGVIVNIQERKNQFVRPPISNIDMLVVVVSASKPKINYNLLDKLLVMAENMNVEILICINKIDESLQMAEEITSIYQNVYTVVSVSAKLDEGIEELKRNLSNKKIAFAGASGVGKSTIINAIRNNCELETGDLSNKTKRGKHTTRHVEIFTVDDIEVFDTPGFTSFDILNVETLDLQLYYPEIYKYKSKCRYDDCLHLKEPSCAVRDAVENGKIHRSRYSSYISQLEELKNKKR